MRKLLQFFYKALWITKFRLLNIIYTRLFRIILFVNKVEFGMKVRAYGAIPMVRINNKSGTISIGSNCIFNNYNDAGWYSKCSIWVRKNAELHIGNSTGFNGVMIYAANSIEIGSNVKIGGGTRLFDTDFHPLDYIQRRITVEGSRTSPVKIEDDVFIGTNCIICKGVTIGARSIIAAGSVVVKSVPADEIWGGAPARLLRKIS